MTSRAPVFVTDGDQRASLALVRSLGAAGFPVHVLAAAPGSLAGASRHAAAEHRVPSVALEPEAFAKATAELLERHPGALLVPVSEMSLGTVQRAGLAGRFAVAAPPEEACRRALDKAALLEAAAVAGLETPRGLVLRGPGPAPPLPEPLRGPVVVKPVVSCWLREGRWRRGGARRVHGPDQVAEALRHAEVPLLVQEVVPGRGEGFFFLRHRGRVRARFAHRRLREKPPEGGVATLSEAIAPDPALVPACERLLDALGYEGIGMLEFRRTPGGRAVLMELNPRPWGSLQLAVEAGADFPRLLVAAARGEPLPAVAPRAGVRVRWLLGDVDHLLAALRAGHGGPALRGFLRSFADGTRLEVLRRDDPWPFLRELAGWLARREPLP